jgi:hypothetical protein
LFNVKRAVFHLNWLLFNAVINIAEILLTWHFNKNRYH